MTLEDWPHRVIIFVPSWWEVEDWCRHNLGEWNKDWYKLGIDPLTAFTAVGMQSVWYFKDSKKALLFQLKWL
jgi:hypothetical protein